MKITDIEKRIIQELRDPLYSVEFVNDWLSRPTENVFVNAPAALQQAMVEGFMVAVRKLSERVRCAQVRWCAEDVIAVAERNGITLTPAQAEKWLEKIEQWIREIPIEYVNEVLASASKESFEEAKREMPAIFTHDEAANIVELFEETLSAFKVVLPSPEDDEKDPCNSAPLYGSTYSNLLDNVEEILIALLERCNAQNVITGVFS